jgi:hypothetical protein
MWDGKSCTSIAKTYLEENKKLSSSSCHVCLATPKDMNKAEVWDRTIMTELLSYSCTPLHMWIRSMEYLFNMACRLPNEDKISTSSKEFQDNKLALQARFWARLNLRISVVKHGKGSTNNGNTARKFFKKNQAVTADILGIDRNIICLFAELLDMFNDPVDKPCSKVFETKAIQSFGLLVSPPLDRFPMTQSVHRFLCHGAAFIEEFELPIGALSESALEARNKYNRSAREHHARKTSMKDNVHDVFNYLLCTSDPHLFLAKSK